MKLHTIAPLRIPKLPLKDWAEVSVPVSERLRARDIKVSGREAAAAYVPDSKAVKCL